jgi:putative hemolysin
VTEIALYAVLISGCLISQGFFSGSEIALVSADRFALAAAANDRPGARMAVELLEREDRLLSTCLIGTNLSLVTGTTLVSALLVHLGHDSGPMALAFVPFALILGEALPKTVFRHYADALAPFLAYPLSTAQRVLAVPLAVLGVWSRALSVMVGAEDQLKLTRQDIVELLEREEPDDLGPQERQLIRAVFEIKDTTVETCMTPLVDVDAVAEDASVGEAIAVADENGRSRLPVYRDRIDAIIGFVECADLLFAGDHDLIASYVRSVRIVPETKRADSLLQELRAGPDHIAMVVDEYGGSVGIVTVEDVLEELFGEINDEHDDAANPLKRLPDGQWRVPARTEIGELEEVLGVEVPEGDYETVAGLVLATLGRIPRKGEGVTVANLRIRVEEATDRAIRVVHVQVLTDPPATH